MKVPIDYKRRVMISVSPGNWNSVRIAAFGEGKTTGEYLMDLHLKSIKLGDDIPSGGAVGVAKPMMPKLESVRGVIKDGGLGGRFNPIPKKGGKK